MLIYSRRNFEPLLLSQNARGREGLRNELEQIFHEKEKSIVRSKRVQVKNKTKKLFYEVLAQQNIILVTSNIVIPRLIYSERH